jgi:1,4-alpha-glucan branching enzyme
MGGEFGQWREWTETESLDWHLLDDSLHGGVQKLVRDLNEIYGPESALWEADGEPDGFEWLDVNNASENILAFVRRSPQTGREIISVSNFSAVPRQDYRVELLASGKYNLIINSSAEVYGGSNNASIQNNLIDLPPLTTLWFASRKATKKSRPQRGTRSTKKKSSKNRAKK